LRIAQRHPLLFEAQHVQFEISTGDLLALQLNDPPDAVLGVHDVITHDKA
jgi:hypothetical protein